MRKEEQSSRQIVMCHLMGIVGIDFHNAVRKRIELIKRYDLSPKPSTNGKSDRLI